MTFMEQPCHGCRYPLGKCLDLALSDADGMPDVCCADCDHEAASAPSAVSDGG